MPQSNFKDLHVREISFAPSKHTLYISLSARAFHSMNAKKFWTSMAEKSPSCPHEEHRYIAVDCESHTDLSERVVKGKKPDMQVKVLKSRVLYSVGSVGPIKGVLPGIILHDKRPSEEGKILAGRPSEEGRIHAGRHSSHCNCALLIHGTLNLTLHLWLNFFSGPPKEIIVTVQYPVAGVDPSLFRLTANRLISKVRSTLPQVHELHLW